MTLAVGKMLAVVVESIGVRHAGHEDPRHFVATSDEAFIAEPQRKNRGRWQVPHNVSEVQPCRPRMVRVDLASTNPLWQEVTSQGRYQSQVDEGKDLTFV